MIDYTQELEDYKKPFVPDAEEGYPLEKLNPRSFEVLLYHIFKIDDELTSKGDVVELMQGVGERGRDCIVVREGLSVAAIQCKHSKNVSKRYSLNDVGEEIVKFILNAIQDESLLPNRKNFIYYFATNTDVQEKANTLFLTNNIYPGRYPKPIKNWIKNNLKKFKKIQLENNTELFDQVCDVFKTIKIIKMSGVDINKKISDHGSSISKLFFDIKLVVDNSLAIKINNILEDIVIPKIDLLIKNNNGNDIESNMYLEGITKYLNAAYEIHSYVRTIIFGNNKQKIHDLYVPLTITCKKTKRKYTIAQNTKELLAENNNILIASTAGMGKSTIVKRVFLEAIDKKLGIPIFIELRRLTDKNSIIKEILKKLKPLYGKIAPKSFIQLIDQGEFIFILDGFDEIEDRHKEKVIQKLNDFIEKARFNNFIITSRPETALASFANFQEFRIEELSIENSIDVLKKYGRDIEHSNELIAKINSGDIVGIEEFLKNPLLVSLLYKAYEYKRKIPYKKHLFYSQVFDALFENHDLTKDGFEREKKSKLDINNFESVLRYIAYKTAVVRKTEYLKSELLELVKKSQNFLGIRFSSVNFIKDLTSTVPLFTNEGNYYNWSHKSLQDYFAAKFIQTDSGKDQILIMKKIYESIHCDRFNNILDILYELDFKTFRNTIIYWISSEYKIFSEDNYQNYPNVKSEIRNRRVELSFKKKIFILGNDSQELMFREASKPIYRSKTHTQVGKRVLSTLHHFHIFFLFFLAEKGSSIVSKVDRLLSIWKKDISIGDSNLEVNDAKGKWFNLDKNEFEYFTELLYLNSRIKINHNQCLSMNESIKNDIKLTKEDDLLQFE